MVPQILRPWILTALFFAFGCDVVHSARLYVAEPLPSVDPAFIDIAAQQGVTCRSEEHPTAMPRKSIHFSSETSRIYACARGGFIVATAHLAETGGISLIELYAGAGYSEPEDFRSFRKSISEGLSSRFGDRVKLPTSQ